MLAGFGEIAEPIVGRVHEFMRPRGQILNAQRDGLTVTVEAQLTRFRPVERFDRQAPCPRHVHQRKRSDEFMRFPIGFQRVSVRLFMAENDAMLEADQNGNGFRFAGFVVLHLALDVTGNENRETVFPFFHVPADGFPLAKAPRIVETGQRGQELIIPTPGPAGSFIVAPNEDRRERGRHVAGLE
jgi:hypothetical protein